MADSPRNPKPENSGDNNSPEAAIPVPGSAGSSESADLGDSATNPACGISSARWLCSELVTISWNDPSGELRTQVANLEEIWREGASLDAEEAVPEGIPVLLTRCPESLSEPDPDPNQRAMVRPQEFRAAVSYCRRNATGFALGIDFLPGSYWSSDSPPPAHALDAAELDRKAKAGLAMQAHAPGSLADPGMTNQSQRRAANEMVELGSLFRLSVHTAGCQSG